MSFMTWALFKSCQVACSFREQTTMLSQKFANLDGATPLMIASFLGNVPAVQRLLDAQASVNETNSYGRTALVLAVMMDHTLLVSNLLESGAESTAPDCWGRTAAMWAKVRNNEDSLALLPAIGPKQASWCVCSSHDVLKREAEQAEARAKEYGRAVPEDAEECEPFPTVSCTNASIQKL